MTGDAGSDLFAFGTNWSFDTINNFEGGVDKIDLRGSGLTFSDLTVTDYFGFATVISSAAGEIQLVGVDPNQVTAADFLV